MRTLGPAFCVLAVILTATAPAHSEPFKLEYRSGDPSERGISPGEREAVPLAALPEGVSLPPNAGVNPFFAKWETPLAKGGFVYLAATKNEENGLYESLFVDTNCDGKLADESPIASIERGPERFAPVDLVFPGQGTDLRYRIAVQVRTVGYMSYPAREVTTLVVQSDCWYEGDVILDGQTYRIALVDGTANGVFDDTSMDLSKVDFIAIGEAGAKTLDHRCMGKYIQIGGKIYHPKPARFGGGIEFLPPEPFTTGTVRVNGEATSLTLASENGELSFDLVDGKAAFPVGKWIPKFWTSTRKDADGASWTLKAVDFPPRTIFEVIDGRESILDTGEPVNARIGWAGEYRGVTDGPMKPVYFFAIGGRIGEVVHVTRNGARPPAPVLRIRSADGAFDETVAFEYGWGSDYTLSWREPPDAKGPFTGSFEFQTPFKMNAEPLTTIDAPPPLKLPDPRLQ